MLFGHIRVDRYHHINNLFDFDLKTLRAMSGTTQEAMAAQLKCNAATISRYESGSSTPDFQTKEIVVRTLLDSAIVAKQHLLSRHEPTCMCPQTVALREDVEQLRFLRVQLFPGDPYNPRNNVPIPPSLEEQRSLDQSGYTPPDPQGVNKYLYRR